MDGINEWLPLWEADGWTRRGRPLENADLWSVMRCALQALSTAGDFGIVVRHVPAYTCGHMAMRDQTG